MKQVTDQNRNLEAAMPASEDLTRLAAQLKATIDVMEEAKDTDTARWNEAKAENSRISAELTELKSAQDAKDRDEAHAKAHTDTAALLESIRQPSKAQAFGNSIPGHVTGQQGYNAGDFIGGVADASDKDAERQSIGKATLRSMGLQHEEAWGKSTLGTTDATGGWIIPNAIVADFIAPAQVQDIYRNLMTVVPGVTAFAVDLPFRSAARTRAAIALFGQTKENTDLAYNGYTATMYTLARIYDIGNQFLRQSRGAAEADVLSELAAAFAQGEAYYIREGSGSNQPFGYTPALTNGPAAFRTTFSPSATTLAGSIATSIATAAGALAGRGVRADGAVLSASVYWTMLSQGTDTAGFFFNPAGGPTAINVPQGTLISPWGLPVYPDADADLEGTAAVIDNLVVAQWKAFKVYFGQSYRVDSSDTAGTRWDTNLTGFRGEEEMGFDARPVVYAGYAQMITDVTP
jgi:HK97 family phage major capsid protein